MRDSSSSAEQFKAIDTTVVEWDKSFNPKLGVELGRLMLRKDPKNGAEIRMIRYPKGVVNPEHTHPCGHGIFVLEGKLRTHEGTYGPGTWVWFPQDERLVAGRAEAHLGDSRRLRGAHQGVWHGATDESDMVGIFITDGAFDIFYKDDE